MIGWSYGGYVICDYLRRFGDRNIAGIHLVAAGVVLEAPARSNAELAAFARKAVGGARGWS